MIRLIFILLSVVASFSYGKEHFTYEDCSTSPNKLVHVENARLSQDPILFPANETGEIDVHLLKAISGRHHEMHVHIQKKVLGLYAPMPCISNVGSCTYQVCDLLSGQYFNTSNHCPIEIIRSTPNFPCTCPIDAGVYHLNPSTFFVPQPSGLWSFFAGGDYHIQATITDTDTNEEVACYRATFRVEEKKEPCSGFFGCIIG